MRLRLLPETAAIRHNPGALKRKGLFGRLLCAHRHGHAYYVDAARCREGWTCRGCGTILYEERVA